MWIIESKAQSNQFGGHNFTVSPQNLNSQNSKSRVSNPTSKYKWSYWTTAHPSFLSGNACMQEFKSPGSGIWFITWTFESRACKQAGEELFTASPRPPRRCKSKNSIWISCYIVLVHLHMYNLCLSLSLYIYIYIHTVREALARAMFIVTGPGLSLPDVFMYYVCIHAFMNQLINLLLCVFILLDSYILFLVSCSF